jgi:hypothetical protein
MIRTFVESRSLIASLRIDATRHETVTDNECLTGAQGLSTKKGAFELSVLRKELLVVTGRTKMTPATKLRAAFRRAGLKS